MPLSGRVKKGLAAAFPKFDEYQLAKYDHRTPIRAAGDVLSPTAMPSPVMGLQAAMWKKLIAGTLTTPDAWEVACRPELTSARPFGSNFFAEQETRRAGVPP